MMTYDIETKDGIVLQNIPDDLDPQGPEVRKKIEEIRLNRGEGPTIDKAQGGYDSLDNKKRLMQQQFSGLPEDEKPQLSPKYNKAIELTRNMFNSASFEFADELEASVRSKFSNETYDNIVKELRAQQTQYRADHPTEAILTAIAAGFVTGSTALQVLKQYPKAKIWLDANKNSSFGKRLLKNAGLGGAGGAVAGAGAYDPAKDESLIGSVSTYGAGGAVAAPALQLVISGGGKTIEGTKNLFKNLGIVEGSATEDSLNRIIQRLNKENITPQDIERELASAQRLGLNDVQLGELSNALRTLSRQSYRVPTESTDDVVEAMISRSDAMRNVTLNALHKSMKVKSDIFDSEYIFQLAEKQRRAARKAYPEAYSQTISSENYIVDDVNLFTTDIIKDAWETYAKNVKKTTFSKEKLPTWKELSKMKDIPTEYLHKIKIGLDDLIEQGTEPITGKLNSNSVRILRSKRIFDDITREQNPLYAQANDEFADSARLKDAFALGKKYDKMDTSSLQRNIDTLNEGELEAFKVGVLNSINNIFETKTGGDIMRVVYGSERKREALKKLFPDAEDFEDFQKLVKFNANRNKTSNVLFGNSATNIRTAEDIIDNIDPSQPNYISILVSKLKSTVGMPEATAEQLKKDLLLSSESDQKRILQMIKDKYLKQKKKDRIFDLIKAGAYTSSVQAQPTTARSIVQPYLTEEQEKQLQSIML